MLSLVLLPERVCATCTATQKERWGCDKDLPAPLEFDGQELKRCPRRPLLDETDYFDNIFDVYSWYKQGHLPEEGTWRDQPAKFCSTMRAMERAFNEADDEKRAREESKRNRASPKVKIV